MAKTKTAAATKAAEPLKANTKNAKVTKSETKAAKMDDDFEEFPSSDEEGGDQDESDNGEFEGFGSTDDEKEKEEKPVPKVDQAMKDKVEKKVKKGKQQPADDDSAKKPRVVYVGRVPHGFYEKQMQQYFSQFGPITRLRLSRNKKTGKSKHYAFVEFDNHFAAEAVSEVMDGYLLFGHILQVKLMPWEKVHDELFVGANKTFKNIPWQRISKHNHDKPKSDEKWAELQSKHDKKAGEKNEKLKSAGIEYAYSNSPAPKKAGAKAKKTASSPASVPATKRKTRSSKK